MTKTLSLASVAVLAITLQAQTPAAPQAPDPAASSGMTQPQTSTAAQQAARTAKTVQATSVSAELTKSIDSKKAKVGDEVNAKITDQAKLPDGTELPKGTKLMGNVVGVTAKTKEQKNSQIVLALNRAVLKDGHEVPIRAAVTSMTAPASSSPAMDMGAGGGGGGAAPSGGGSSSGAGGGGSAGGATAAPSAPAMSSDMGSSAQPAQGAMLKSAQDRVAVGNMPDVMLSAPTTPDSAGVLEAAGKNISLDSGTKFTANVIVAQNNMPGQ